MADAYLLDTGVFLRWFVDQPGYEHAREVQQRFLDGELALETIDFARVEVAEVLRKKGLLAKRLDRDAFLAGVQVIDDLGVVVHRVDAHRLGEAAALAVRYSLRMFDALFVQAALERGLPLLTADGKLCEAAHGLVQTDLLRGVRAR